ncbi:MAG: hypothetical protein QOF15_4236 [Mycobacterium sp.]|nr:hypothetical protein [Mycobacterium sp.]
MVPVAPRPKLAPFRLVPARVQPQPEVVRAAAQVAPRGTVAVARAWGADRRWALGAAEVWTARQRARSPARRPPAVARTRIAAAGVAAVGTRAKVHRSALAADSAARAGVLVLLRPGELGEELAATSQWAAPRRHCLWPLVDTKHSDQKMIARHPLRSRNHERAERACHSRPASEPLRSSSKDFKHEKGRDPTDG